MATEGKPSRRVVLRTIVDMTISLLIAVTVFRTFAAQGYMIETGSMGPSLLGFHQQVTCPSCGFPFAVGHDPHPGRAVCPNCGQHGLPLDMLPKNDGDQLLVFREAFEFRPPRRWEVIVFRNPSQPTQAYVKRLIGLPGETVQIRDGDIYVEGHIQAKPLVVQRGMRVLVHDFDRRPPDDDPEWRPRWNLDASSTQWRSVDGRLVFDGSLPVKALTTREETPTAGSFAATGARGGTTTSAHNTLKPQTGDAGTDTVAPKQPTIDKAPRSDSDSATGIKRDLPPSDGTSHAETPPSESDEARLQWVSYRHWIRRGGRHRTSIPLATWPDGPTPPPNAIGQLQFLADEGQLVCTGAMTETQRERLLGVSDSRAFQQLIARLYDASHIAPITDYYAYNCGRDIDDEYEVRDLMFASHLTLSGEAGLLAIEMSDGTERGRCEFDLRDQTVRLRVGTTGRVERSAALPSELSHGGALVEISLMDRQLLVAVNGRLLFDPWHYAEDLPAGETAWQPVRIGAHAVHAQLRQVKLYRDIYYTAGEGRRATDAPIRLRSNEYFVLGDNSPISRDSRSWEAEHRLTSEHFVGKPFIVHLPSRKRRVAIGRWTFEIRVPEFSQIRYIR